MALTALSYLIVHGICVMDRTSWRTLFKGGWLFMFSVFAMVVTSAYGGLSILFPDSFNISIALPMFACAITMVCLTDKSRRRLKRDDWHENQRSR